MIKIRAIRLEPANWLAKLLWKALKVAIKVEEWEPNTNLNGKTAHCIIVDEAVPMPKGQLAMFSTPKGKGSIFEDLLKPKIKGGKDDN